MTGRLPGPHGTGLLNGPSEKQQLFGQRRFSGIRVADYSECAPPAYFFLMLTVHLKTSYITCFLFPWIAHRHIFFRSSFRYFAFDIFRMETPQCFRKADGIEKARN
jgi:hypothetical protein